MTLGPLTHWKFQHRFGEQKSLCHSRPLLSLRVSLVFPGLSLSLSLFLSLSLSFWTNLVSSSCLPPSGLHPLPSLPGSFERAVVRPTCLSVRVQFLFLCSQGKKFSRNFLGKFPCNSRPHLSLCVSLVFPGLSLSVSFWTNLVSNSCLPTLPHHPFSSPENQTTDARAGGH